MPSAKLRFDRSRLTDELWRLAEQRGCWGVEMVVRKARLEYGMNEVNGKTALVGRIEDL